MSFHDHHDPGHRAGLRRAVEAIFHLHSHDVADSVDTALAASEQGMHAIKVSFVALVATGVAQLLVLLATGSVALLADTIHNLSDALTAVPLFIAFRLSRRPATRRYTYGYRRAEDLAGIFVIAMIALSATIAAYEAVSRLLNPRALTNIGWLFAAGLIGFVGNEIVAVYRVRVGRRIGSAALEADGDHARTDGFTSLAVALGAVGSWLGFERADPIVGLLISIAILAVLRTAAVQIFRRLMDSVDPVIVDSIERTARQTNGVERVNSVQARWVGHRLAASVAIVVDEDMSVRQGHDVGEMVRHELHHAVSHLDDIDIHVDPNGRSGIDPHAASRQHC